jgi:hypothetical protein
VFPPDSNDWTDYGSQPRRIAAARVDSLGRYELRGLPAGEYLIVAVDEASISGWHSPSLFRAMAAAASRIRLAAGDQRVHNLATSALK